MTAALVAGISLPLATHASADTGDDITRVQQQLAALQSQADAATEAYDAGQISLAAAQRAAAAADASVTRESTALATQTAGASRLAADQYRDGGMGKLLTFVGSGNPSVFLDQASTLQDLNTAQAERLDQLKAAAKRLADAKTLDAAKQADASSAAAKLAGDKAHVENLISQQQQLLSGLQAKQRAELLARQQAAARAAAAAAAKERAAAAAQAQAAVQRAAVEAAAQPVNSTVTSTPTPAAAADPAPAATSTTTGSATATGPTATSSPSASATDGSTAGGTSATNSTPAIPSSDRASVALSAAYAELGKPYQYGGAGPDAFDCSGLTMWAFAKAGIALPHSAAAQYGYGTHVSLSQLQPGDLVFFNEGGVIGHVGIYAGNGTMVDAPHTGSTVGVHALYPGFVGGTRL